MSQEKLRAVTMLYDDRGFPVGSSYLSPTENTTRAACIVPPEKVLPVIFVPGIMGSNLKFKKALGWFNKGEDVSWRPDDPKYTAWTFANLKPAERRLILDPENTELDERAEIPDSRLPAFKAVDKNTRENWKKEYTRRGWGTVMLSSYAEILYSLEFNLNSIYDDAHNVSGYWLESILSIKSAASGERDDQHPWGEMTGFEALSESDLKEKVGDEYWFPVHAAGYNWLRSNGEAGKDIAQRIQTIIKHYRDLGFPCEKAIIVTHSMGGLAARAACHADMGNAEAYIAGVVHGEQPAIGAAAAYKRMHSGFEAGFNLKNAIIARALGWSGKEVTACLANAPGGLELLPTKLYPPGWLQVQSDTKIEMQLPVANPYAEIYAEKDKWWRLMTPEWISPSNTPSAPEDLDDIWKKYITRLISVENFHDKLSDYYHPVTHAHYGADDKHSAWTTFTWKLSGYASERASFSTNVLTAPLASSNALGKIGITSDGVEMNFEMRPPDKPGDGTVPEVSGAASASKAKFAAKMKGYDHQGSYQNQHVKDVTTYSIVRIAKDI